MTKPSSSPPAYDWRRRIQTCVTIDKMIFAGGDAERGNAFSLLIYLRKKHVPWVEIKAAFKHYFATRTGDKAAIKEQMAIVKAHYRCWL